MIDADRTSLAAYVAHRRIALGLTPNGLAHRTTTTSSSYIQDVEAGIRTHLTPKLARQIAVALELSDPEADHFLHLAGVATVIDWQRLAEEILTPLGLASELHERASRLYAQLRPDPAARRPHRGH